MNKIFIFLIFMIFNIASAHAITHANDIKEIINKNNETQNINATLINKDYKSIFDDENYDIYCEYVKLKKSTISMIKALCIILKKINKMNVVEEIIENIFNDLNNFITTTDYKHVNELLLDEIAIIIDFIPKQKYINQITKIDISNLDTSTKFKIAKIGRAHV
jgi:hypothetical protein